ncbi:MAG: hypothetical protein ACYC77_04085 [Coriobacteriia bacterium]
MSQRAAHILAVLVLVVLGAGCGQQDQSRSPETASESVDATHTAPAAADRAITSAMESTVPSVTTVRHYFAPGMYVGPNGPFGAHDIDVESVSTDVDESDVLRALLAADHVYQDESAIFLIVVYPAPDGTGVVRGYEWVRPLSRMNVWSARAELPASDAIEEMGLAGKAEAVSAESMEAALTDPDALHWIQEPVFQ